MKWWEWLIVALVIVWLIDRNRQAGADPIAAALAPHYTSELQSTIRPNSFFDEAGGDSRFTLTQPAPVVVSGTSTFIAGGGGGSNPDSGGTSGGKGRLNIL